MSLAVKQKTNNLALSFDEMTKMADIFAKSDLSPKEFKGKPENCFIAIQMGQEIGLTPIQALQSIAVVNGRPSIYGDAALALVLASPVCEDVIEVELKDNTGYSCTAIRKGQEPRTVEFTIEKAKTAGLWAKPGPWSNYPSRMLQMRARGFALRDKFSDVLKGLSLVEEAMDMPGEKIINSEADNIHNNQISKLKNKLFKEQNDYISLESIDKKEQETEIMQEKISDDSFTYALTEFSKIKTIDELTEKCKELASKIEDIDKRKHLEKAYKERKKELEREKFKLDLGEV